MGSRCARRDPGVSDRHAPLLPMASGARERLAFERARNRRRSAAHGRQRGGRARAPRRLLWVRPVHAHCVRALHSTNPHALSGRGGIRTPETGFARLTVFKTAAFNRSATLPRGAQMLRALQAAACEAAQRTTRTARPPAGLARRALPGSKLGPRIPRRGGRVAEGTRLLSEYGGQTPSRVRIPPSPSV
jgi:hypothetical protein